MAEEHIKNRNSLLVKHILVMPLTISIIVLIVAYIISPGLLVDSEYKTTKAFDLFLVIVPFFYIIAVIIYGIKMAANEKNPMEKGRHLYIGLFPLIAVAWGFLQMMLMPELPVFCFSSTILMMVFYIHSMESQISTDPLTKLNNRGQLLRYVSQESSLWMEGRSTYVVMIDINDFKKINDTYGHWEGDSALILLSSAITNVIRKRSIPIFLARYGGDEFILIAHPADENELNTLIENIRLSIIEKCEKENKPYRMQVGIGLDKLNKEEQDAFSKALKRADDKMYENKKSLKK
jgi:diguanylate cyclase (GGDEF)-like protein